MFRFTKKPSSESHSQCLVKIKRRDRHTLAHCTTHTPRRSFYTAIALTTSAQRLSLLVILAKHWLWLPDDVFFVNRNMLEQPL